MRAPYDPNTAYIAVSFDRSDPTNPAWIVSRDDYYGSDVIQEFDADSRDMAVAFARKVGRAHGFPVKIQD